MKFPWIIECNKAPSLVVLTRSMTTNKKLTYAHQTMKVSIVEMFAMGSNVIFPKFVKGEMWCKGLSFYYRGKKVGF